MDDNGDAVMHDDNYGGYAIIDQMLYREKDDQGLGGFFMGSWAPQNRNSIDHQIAAGFNYTGLLPMRDADVAGIAFTNSSLNPKARAVNGTERYENTIEVTYRIVINDHLAIQPDIQYVMNPGGDPAIRNATVFTLRTELTF